MIKDERKPIIQGIIVYPLDSTTVNNAQKPINISFNKQTDGTYLCSKVKANGRIAFGINAYDYCTNAYNKNGLYKAKAYLNGVLQYQYGFDTFAFDESRYINNFIDYERFHDMGQRVQKLFELNKTYIPNKLIAGSTDENNLPLLENRYVSRETFIYVCVKKACRLPVKTTEEALGFIN